MNITFPVSLEEANQIFLSKGQKENVFKEQTSNV